jgi:hypothetical protein
VERTERKADHSEDGEQPVRKKGRRRGGAPKGRRPELAPGLVDPLAEPKARIGCAYVQMVKRRRRDSDFPRRDVWRIRSKARLTPIAVHHVAPTSWSK